MFKWVAMQACIFTNVWDYFMVLSVKQSLGHMASDGVA